MPEDTQPDKPKETLAVVTSKVRPPVKTRLRKLAKRTKRTLSQYVSHVLEEHVNQPEAGK